jgi:hypothetical protein
MGRSSVRGKTAANGCAYAAKAEPDRTCSMGANETGDRPLAATGSHPLSLSFCPFARHDLGRVITRGKSRMRAICTSGSVRGVWSNPYPYRNAPAPDARQGGAIRRFSADPNCGRTACREVGARGGSLGTPDKVATRLSTGGPKTRISEGRESTVSSPLGIERKEGTSCFLI